MASLGSEMSEEELVFEAVQMLLNISREKIAQGSGEEALAAVLHAVRLTRGEEAIMDVLGEAKRRSEERYDAEVAKQVGVAREMCQDLLRQETILMETGSEDILRQAFEDGSSVVCRKCGALVSVARWEAHRDVWCSSLEEKGDDPG